MMQVPAEKTVLITYFRYISDSTLLFWYMNGVVLMKTIGIFTNYSHLRMKKPFLRFFLKVKNISIFFSWNINRHILPNKTHFLFFLSE